MRKTLILFASAILCTGIASAQSNEPFASSTRLGTPDGIPPSEETVCDGLTGAAYGLCTAYCGAMDCDSGDPQASQRACDRVGENFARITGGAPPCTCPCVGRIPDFIEALNGDFGLTACIGFSLAGFSDFVALQTADPVRFPGSQTVIPGSYGFCGFAFGPGGDLQITFEEAEACNALIRQKGAEAGLSCPPPL